MSSTEFLNKENIEMIWEIIIDEISPKNKNIVKKLFIEECYNFYNREKLNYKDLLSINKSFITEIIRFLKSQMEPKKLITYEEIKNNNINNFEIEFQQKRSDFNNYMNLNVPEKPKFNIDINDEPINEMEDLIKKTLEQRNFDIEKIVNENSNKENVSVFLKSQETSVKTEKNKENDIRYIKIDNNSLDKNENKFDVIDLNIPLKNDNKKKTITWADNIEQDNMTQIISNLKPLNVDDDNSNNNIDNDLITYFNYKFDELNFKIDNLYSLFISKNSL